MKKEGWKRYHTIWGLLFLGWFVSYIDRTATGPVVTYMIENEIGFFANVANPHGIGGLIGSLFFAGFMLMQFPGGYLGDRFGYRTIIILSVVWAGIATLLTGVAGGLIAFILFRVILGLGEGAFYSNDRSYIAYHTPPKKVGLGMGVALTGLSVGLTAGTLGVPFLITTAEPFMGEEAWRFPFFVMGIITLVSAFFIFKYMKPKNNPNQSVDHSSPGIKVQFNKALLYMSMYSAVFLVIVMGIYYFSIKLGLSNIAIAIILVALCPLLIFYLYTTKKSEIKPILANKNLFLLYLFFIPIMWHLWFYGFWSVSIVKDFGGGALMAAALIASFNALAGIIGFPLGGKISDMVADRPNGRRNVLAILTAALTVLIFIFAAYVMMGNNSPIVMSIILFVSGLFFFALQPVAHALASDLTPEKSRGSMFGMLNLIAEIGAVLSPVISGVLRDNTGSWGIPLVLDGILMAAGLLLVLGVSSKIALHNSGTLKKKIS
ncbi:MFS transporter [Peribacillus huizhouensis]|uniref:MFS family permease n=1 Tax=Peribacillus huizhouensis TaxID=1501239 RepID=A0ABR6CUI7_9BACI|nr:MFS transporter [Peribacillus huizhouensis]MBA9028625.1 MFS family permease [Peribacillus huizhouensis]